MRQELKSLRLRQMDQSLKPWSALISQPPPRGGWLRSIRQALGMSTAQLGRRMGLSRQSIAELERRETSGAVTLATLEKAAKAMNANLVYAIVPRKSLTETVTEQARKRAENELRRVAHTMRLEAQDVSQEEFAHQLEDKQERLLRNWSRRIWDEED